MIQELLLPIMACIVSLFALIYFGAWFSEWVEKWFD